MSLLKNYSPLRSLTIPGIELNELKGIVVVVGPNSSGKSLLLRDIHAYLTKGKTESIVCTRIKGQPPSDCEELIRDLKEKRYLRHIGGNTYITDVPFFNLSNSDNQERVNFTLPQLIASCEEFRTATNSHKIWFERIGPAIVASLDIDVRRQLCNRSVTFDCEKTTADQPLQALSLNSEAQDQLRIESAQVFRNAVWLDITNKDFLQLRVSGQSDWPPVGKMINPLEAKNYRPIESEGDGYRSYVSICLSLLVGTRPVTLIDEPELCLHPPQAYHIGRFIGSHATSNRVTFVATHSSHVLRGLIESATRLRIAGDAPRLTVVRLTNSANGFCANQLSHELLANAIRNPRSRTESILDGTFSKGVVLVESEGDREVYQAAAEGLLDYPAREIHFVPVGGIGGFLEPMRFYRSLKIPFAIIADFDTLSDTDKLLAIYHELCTDEARCDDVTKRLRVLLQKLKALSPSLSEEDVQARLSALSQREWNWSSGGDNVLRRELRTFERELKRLNRLKCGGLSAYSDHPELLSELTELVDEFSKAGLFLVPVGELEDWVADLMSDVQMGSLSKTDRAAIAAEHIRLARDRTDDVWEFVANVAAYLDLK